ncbi:MAG TPA: TIGR02270 family protein [Variovorax sp.]|nr:TIGR02270 family protein [Variovorax sp.]
MRNPLPHIVLQHAEESANLCSMRSVLITAPHVRLHALRRLDERLAAHLDGLAVAGEFGWGLCEAALAEGAAGETFTACVRAIEDGNAAALEQVLAQAEALPTAHAGAASAFSWVSAQWLKGLTRGLLDSPSAFRRALGIVACVSHQVDPGGALVAALSDPDPFLRARALHAAGECGRIDLRDACAAALSDEEESCRFHAAASLALLGRQDAAQAALQRVAMAPGPHRRAALALLLSQGSPAQTSALLKTLFDDAGSLRALVQGIGFAGDPRFVPWLIERMADPKLARLAGESLCMITGLDMNAADVAGQTPEAGAQEAPEEDEMALDEDEGLPWLDASKLSAWWSAHAHGFVPGVRYFLAAPPSASHCLAVLRSGYQRQRIAAARHLCLLQPGSKLFPTAAPAWRQQRWLDAMSA